MTSGGHMTVTWGLTVTRLVLSVFSGGSGAQRLPEVSEAWGGSQYDVQRVEGRTLIQFHPPIRTDQLVSMTTGMSESWFCWQTRTWTLTRDGRTVQSDYQTNTHPLWCHTWHHPWHHQAACWLMLKWFVFYYLFCIGGGRRSDSLIKHDWYLIPIHETNILYTNS